MIIFLYGTDSYRLRSDLNSIIEKYRNKYPENFDLVKIDLENEKEFEGLENAVKNISFFGGKKMVVAVNIFNNKKVSEKAGELIRGQDILKSPEVILVAVETKDKKTLEKNKELFRILDDKSNTVRTYDPLSGGQLIKWVRSEFERKDCQISPEEAGWLINLAGNDSYALANEIDKISNYKLKGTIGKEDINILVNSRIDPNIFELTDAISTREKGRVFELLYAEQKNGRDPFYLLSMIINQFRNILIVKDMASRGLAGAQIAQRAGLHPFVVKKALASIDRFEAGKLRNIYRELLNIEVGSKTGTKDIDLELSRLAFSI